MLTIFNQFLAWRVENWCVVSATHPARKKPPCSLCIDNRGQQSDVGQSLATFMPLDTKRREEFCQNRGHFLPCNAVVSGSGMLWHWTVFGDSVLSRKHGPSRQELLLLTCARSLTKLIQICPVHWPVQCMVPFQYCTPGSGPPLPTITSPDLWDQNCILGLKMGGNMVLEAPLVPILTPEINSWGKINKLLSSVLIFLLFSGMWC